MSENTNDPAAALAKMRDELKAFRDLFPASEVWQDGLAGICNVVQFTTDDIKGVADVPSTSRRKFVIHAANTAAPLITAIDAVLASVAAKDAEIARLRKECKDMRALAQLGTHRVIACGVAATHPDASLMDRGAYADEWRTQQSDEVRELRRDRDALRARLAELEGALNALPRWEHNFQFMRQHHDGTYVDLGDVRKCFLRNYHDAGTTRGD